MKKKELEKHLKDYWRGFERQEIIVVDDGSADKTSEIARELGVRIIRHEKIGT